MRPGDLLAATVALATFAGAAVADDVNRVVLRVNDEIVTLREYEQRRDARIAAITQAEDLSIEERRELVAASGRSTLREIFDELLMVSRARQLRIDLDSSAIDRGVETSRQRFGIDTDEELRAALAEAGMSWEQYRETVRRNLAISEVMQREVGARVSVEEEEMARYWREHQDEFVRPEARRASEVVVVMEDRPDRAAAEALAERLRAAAQTSGSVEGAVESLGVADDVVVLDHGWLVRGELDPALEAALWSAGPDAVLGPIEARGGLHVLRLDEIRPAAVEPFDAVRDRIRGKLRAERYEARSVELLDDLARRAFVVENLPQEAEGYREAPTGDRDPVRALMREAGRPDGEVPTGPEAPTESEAPPA